MSRTFNFNNIEKQYLTVTLADKNKTTLMVKTPTKALFKRLQYMKDNIRNIQRQGEADVIDEMYEICAEIMSCNKGGIQITKEQLENIPDFDYQDIVAFLGAYMSFIGEISKLKN